MINLNSITKKHLKSLDEKKKILKWLILGQGIHSLPLRTVQFLTIERICELYNMTPIDFELL